jgi:hypothetical protein
MPTITSELHTNKSILRGLLEPFDSLIAEWRAQLRAKLGPKPWLLPPNRQRASVTGLAVDFRVRWFLTGVDELPPLVALGLRMCSENTKTAIEEHLALVRGLGPGPHDDESERMLAELGLACASIEPLVRRGPMVVCPVQQLGLATFLTDYRDEIVDAGRLARALPELLGRFSDAEIEPGPIVGVGRLQGDADFRAGTTVCEVKCVSDPQPEAARFLRQVLVYAARLSATEAALVLPRQRTCAVLDLSGHGSELAELDRALADAYM